MGLLASFPSSATHLRTSIQIYYTECPQGMTCLGFGRVSFLHGMPAGHDVSRFRSGIFFFIGVINVHINLCIKLCPSLVRIYCSDCLQQKRPNQNLITREGTHSSLLCDVKSSFDLFIKTRLNSSLSQKGSIVLIVLNKSGPIKLHLISARI